MRGRPREYSNRYPLTVSVEKDLWDFANYYGILARDAISIGLQGSIEHDLIRTKKIPPSEIERYMEIKNRELHYLACTKERESHIINTVSEISGSVDDIIQGNKKENEKGSEEFNWNKVPEDQKVRVYIQHIFTQEERAIWIARYLAADEDTLSKVLKQFCEEFILRFKNDETRPFRKVEAGDIKKALAIWAEAEGGV